MDTAVGRNYELELVEVVVVAVVIDVGGVATRGILFACIPELHGRAESFWV